MVITPEESPTDLAEWLARHAGQVFRVGEIKGGSAMFQSIGPEAEACRAPINITSQSPPPLRLISNFAHTPFVLDGAEFASVEGFWQGLKFPDEPDRRRLAALYDSAAKNAGFAAPPVDAFVYGGRSVRVGTFDHWQLMKRACLAKFEQNEAARDALLSTGTRPLVHQVRQDSRTIPGVIMADIWMRIRARMLGSSKVGERPPVGGPKTASEGGRDEDVDQ
jgi:predicted NAD-dependent protein-ADP-ribosyltransferase YbiA (DUF1768 family)